MFKNCVFRFRFLSLQERDEPSFFRAAPDESLQTARTNHLYQRAMFCSHCGAELPSTANFCPSCGCKSAANTEYPATTPLVQPQPILQQPLQQTQPQPAVCPKNYLTESILVTLFCCLSFGIAGIVQAGKVSSLFAAGRYQEAEAAGRQAKTYVNISFYSGLAFGLIYFVFLLIAAASEIEID